MHKSKIQNKKKLAEKLVIDETRESLIQLRANIDNSNNFFEKNENKVTYHLDKVQEYLSNQKEKPWSDLKKTFATTVAVQIALEALDEKNYQKSIDGIYGADTVRAVTAFQTKWNEEHPDDTITVDGFAWPETIKRLITKLGERQSSENTDQDTQQTGKNPENNTTDKTNITETQKDTTNIDNIKKEKENIQQIISTLGLYYDTNKQVYYFAPNINQSDEQWQYIMINNKKYYNTTDHHNKHQKHLTGEGYTITPQEHGKYTLQRWTYKDGKIQEGIIYNSHTWEIRSGKHKENGIFEGTIRNPNETITHGTVNTSTGKLSNGFVLGQDNKIVRILPPINTGTTNKEEAQTTPLTQQEEAQYKEMLASFEKVGTFEETQNGEKTWKFNKKVLDPTDKTTNITTINLDGKEYTKYHEKLTGLGYQVKQSKENGLYYINIGMFQDGHFVKGIRKRENGNIDNWIYDTTTLNLTHGEMKLPDWTIKKWKFDKDTIKFIDGTITYPDGTIKTFKDGKEVTPETTTQPHTTETITTLTDAEKKEYEQLLTTFETVWKIEENLTTKQKERKLSNGATEVTENGKTTLTIDGKTYNKIGEKEDGIGYKIDKYNNGISYIEIGEFKDWKQIKSITKLSNWDIQTWKFDKNTGNLTEGIYTNTKTWYTEKWTFDKDSGILTNGTITTNDNTRYEWTRDPTKHIFTGTITLTNGKSVEGKWEIPINNKWVWLVKQGKRKWNIKKQ